MAGEGGWPEPLVPPYAPVSLHHVMFSRRFKLGYFTLEGLNSFATVYYFYYFYFFMEKAFGFGTEANLALAALNGGLYALFSWWAGKLACRFGYFRALKFGFVVMALSLATGLWTKSPGGQIAVMVGTVIGMCFTWPTLEALVSEGESAEGVQHMVGTYNMVWAATAAAANFLGGAMLDRFGAHSLFYIPIGIQAVQLALTLWLESQAQAGARPEHVPATGASRASSAAASAALFSKQPSSHEAGDGVDANSWLKRGRRRQGFLSMAWLSNPFAYVAINTVVAAVPGVASRLGLTATLAGFCCSIWCFTRLAAFVWLWLWDGWHYRFRWLLVAFMVLVASFPAMLLAPNVPVLVLAETAFGVAIGLIYYSSLYYSMDLSKTKSEHGGIHEAAIGLGNFAGPAVGAVALQFLPHYANSGALAVSGLLLCGLGGLAAIWRRGRAGAGG